MGNLELTGNNIFIISVVFFMIELVKPFFSCRKSLLLSQILQSMA